MKINPGIFKAYDIRGKYPSEINEETARQIGRALVTYLSRLLKKKRLKILICRDVRLSSPALAYALTKGIAFSGGEVIDVGIGTTPYFYYLMHQKKPDGGIMITASHNPPEYNGFKLRRRGGKAIALGTGLEKIKTLASRTLRVPTENFEILSYPNYRDEYIHFLSRGISIKNPLACVIDAAGGSAVYFLPQILGLFPNLKYKPLFFEPDGSFKKHAPNPLLPEAQRWAREELATGGFRLGAIFDGDGDRIIFLDEKGNPVRSEYIFGLLAAEELKKRPREKVVMSINTSRGVREYLKELGAQVKLSPVGYTFMSRIMEKNKAVLGVEISGHFYLRDFFYEGSAILVMLKVLSLLSKTHRPLSELIKPWQRYVSSGEINYGVGDKKAVLRRVRNFYRRAKISFMDGITVEFPDWWFNLRPSHTEPVARLVVEAKTKELFEEKKKELEKLVKRV